MESFRLSYYHRPLWGRVAHFSFFSQAGQQNKVFLPKKNLNFASLILFDPHDRPKLVIISFTHVYIILFIIISYFAFKIEILCALQIGIDYVC